MRHCHYNHLTFRYILTWHFFSSFALAHDFGAYALVFLVFVPSLVLVKRSLYTSFCPPNGSVCKTISPHFSWRWSWEPRRPKWTVFMYQRAEIRLSGLSAPNAPHSKCSSSSSESNASAAFGLFPNPNIFRFFFLVFKHSLDFVNNWSVIMSCPYLFIRK